jgi:hypothetical protein
MSQFSRSDADRIWASALNRHWSSSMLVSPVQSAASFDNMRDHVDIQNSDIRFDTSSNPIGFAKGDLLGNARAFHLRERVLENAVDRVASHYSDNEHMVSFVAGVINSLILGEQPDRALKVFDRFAARAKPESHLETAMESLRPNMDALRAFMAKPADNQYAQFVHK